MVGSNSIIMLLLSGRRSGSRGLLSMLMLIMLLMHPCWFAVRIELLLVREDVSPLEHLVRSMEPTSLLAG